jgi:hypothetical protein
MPQVLRIAIHMYWRGYSPAGLGLSRLRLLSRAPIVVTWTSTFRSSIVGDVSP